MSGRFGARWRPRRKRIEKLCLPHGETNTEDVPTTAADGTEVTQRVVYHRTLCDNWMSFRPQGNGAFRSITCPSCLAVWDRQTGGGES